MKHESILEWVEEALDFLLAGYPNQTRTWEPGQVRNWKLVHAPIISRYSMPVVSAAISHLHGHIKWLPAAAELTEVLNLKRKEFEAKLPPPMAPPERQLEATNAPTPDSPHVDSYIAGAPNIYEAIARQWEVENKGHVSDEMRAKRAAAVAAATERIGK